MEVIEDSDSDEDGDDDLHAGQADETNAGADPRVQARSDEQSSSAASGSLFRCVMCGKSFQHESNLKNHLQTHLGLKAQLKSCISCRR